MFVHPAVTACACYLAALHTSHINLYSARSPDCDNLTELLPYFLLATLFRPALKMWHPIHREPEV
jgi:hypothetical protein